MMVLSKKSCSFRKVIKIKASDMETSYLCLVAQCTDDYPYFLFSNSAIENFNLAIET